LNGHFTQQQEEASVRHLIWIRVILLSALLLVATGSAMTAAQGDIAGGGDVGQPPFPLTHGMDGGIRHIPPQRSGALQPADAPAFCTRIGFNDSLEGWTVHAGDWYTGTGYIYTKGLEGDWASVSYNLNLTRTDFQAHMWRKGCSGCENGIIIRGNPDPLWDLGLWWNTMYLFVYTNEGGCLVGKSFYYRGIRVYQILFNGSCPSIHTGEAWNTLRAVADGDQLSFYINDELAWSGQDQSLSYGRVGIAMQGNLIGGPANEEFRVAWASLCRPYGAFLPLVMRR